MGSSLTSIHIDKPIIIATCEEVTSFKVRCDASKTIDQENTGVLNFRIYFNEEDMSTGAIAEYEFQSSGEKIIRVEVLNGNNSMAEQKYIVKINPQHTEPVPIFISEVELGKNVSFDAGDSTLQGRKVFSYEWDFGDGTKMRSSTPFANHIYDQNTYYNVSLKVTDEMGGEAVFSEPVYIYDPVVRDPGEAGEIGLAGVDSDENQIRDDVQRWIQFQAKDNIGKKRYMEAIALIYEKNFKNINDLDLVSKNFNLKLKYEQCLKLVDDNIDSREDLQTGLSILYGNTNERARALFQIDGIAAGQVVETEMDLITLDNFCQGVGN